MCVISEFLKLPIKRAGDCKWLCMSRHATGVVEVTQQWTYSRCHDLSTVYPAQGTLPSWQAH